MKKYWFAIYPHCFLWLKGKEGLVYNTENYARIRFCNEGILAHITGQLTVMENLYCIRLLEKELEDESLHEWVQRMIANECGTLVEDDGKNQRPLSLPPILKVQDEAIFYSLTNSYGINGDVIENLHHMVFHINGSTYGNDSYTKQTLFPNTRIETLSADDIFRFSMNARVSPFLAEVSLVGNPFGYEGLDMLIESLQSICPVSVHCTCQDAMASLDDVEELATKVNLHIIVTGHTVLDRLSRNANYTFLVSSEKEYEAALECKRRYILEHTDIVPVYTGNNLPFFENYLYMDEESIQDIALDKREVFIRQKLNIHDFGQLTVMNDGKVYTNINFPAIGCIKETPNDIIYREITNGSAWLRIRDQKPCCDCIYQWLCPSPSHYEDVIGKTYLCHIKP